MTDLNPPNKSVSLDDLLKANKDQFDQLFATQVNEVGLVDVSHRPATEADLMSPSLRGRHDGNGDDVTGFLDSRFGPGWSSEVVEHKVERGMVTVLGKLTVDGVSKMQFGSARANGDQGKALQHATNQALKECAALFTEEIGPADQTEKEPVQDSSIVDKQESATASVPEAPQRAARPTERPGTLDTITLDLIENALRNARHEMDAVLFRSAMSPVIREQHDEFPMITDAKGRMIVGQFGSYIPEMLKEQNFQLNPGDVILQSDPFKCGGAISHINDWMVLVPIFHENQVIGFSSMFGHMMDVGGPVPGSMPTAATSVFGEGLRIPPIKIYEGGTLNKSALDLIMNNTRTPEMNFSDLMAIVAGCRAGEKRVIEICERFGKDIYRQACDALLERTNRAMRQLIVQNMPEEPQSFEDYVDDDGCGNGPFKMKLTVWREGEHAYFDWTGTSAQAPGADQLLSPRRHVQDVHRGLHDHGVRSSDLVQRWLLRSDPCDVAEGVIGASRFSRPHSGVGRTRCPVSSTSWAARSARRHPKWRRRPATDRVRISSTPVSMPRVDLSNSWRSSTGESPAGQSGTGWTATPGGRCLRTSRVNISRAITHY